MNTTNRPTTWVIVASRDHALRGVEGGFVMANHGKRAPIARMNREDRVLIYSPKTDYPDGAPLKAITIAGTITGDAPEDSPIIKDGYRRRADLRAIEPIPLATVREHLPMNKIRFGFFELPPEDAGAIWAIIEGP